MLVVLPWCLLQPIRSMQYRQPGGLGVLREVFHGFSEEARTRGFPSPSFGGFGFAYRLKS